MDLSIVVVFFDMRREAPRTLHSLSRRYQRDVTDLDYEVVAVDNGSKIPLDQQMVASNGSEFRLLRRAPGSPSPAAAINAAVATTSGRLVMVCIDGARLLSPRMLHLTRVAARVHPRPVVASLSWHLGPSIQNESMLQGYDQDREDDLLNESGWEQDGYRLFDLSSWAGSSRSGWFGSASESNCLAVTREHFEQLGGLDEEFGSAGGGLVNLDYYKRACETDAALPIVLLGEGTFHQFHDGVATNVPRERHPFAAFEAEYVRLRGRPYVPPASSALLLGHAPDQALPWLLDSAATALRRLDP